MSPKACLETILSQQTLAEDGPEMKSLNEEKQRVEELIRKEFEQSNPTIKIAGSIAKETAIKVSYDLDVCIYFSCDDKDCGETLKDIYHRVKTCLEKHYYVEQKPVALRLYSNSSTTFGTDYHIDAVPGRFTDETRGDCFLHISVGDKSYFKTNLKTHLKHIKESGLIDQIKLLKVWKARAGLQIRTFILELLIIEILKGSRSSSLEDYLVEFWTKVRDSIFDIKIEDPANPTGNDLSEIFDDTIKQQLKDEASRTLDLISRNRWEDVMGHVEKNESYIGPAIITSAQKYPNAPKPYSDDLV